MRHIVAPGLIGARLEGMKGKKNFKQTIQYRWVQYFALEIEKRLWWLWKPTLGEAFEQTKLCEDQTEMDILSHPYKIFIAQQFGVKVRPNGA